MLGGPWDMCGCEVTIRGGAGGTDAQDWAQILQVSSVKPPLRSLFSLSRIISYHHDHHI